MKNIDHLIYRSYHIGSSLNLSQQQVETLIEDFTCPKKNGGLGLEGRTSVTRIRLDGIGPVVIKHYMRGGFLGHFIKQTYVRPGKPRSAVEFEQLKRVRDLGISAPEPVCFAFRGKVFYNAWLVTREIENQQSLAKLSMANIESAMLAVKKLVPYLVTLIDNKIYHRDLHPGNILVDDHHRVYIIDFDKAGSFRGTKASLTNKYIKRWERAVRKHNLPPEIHDLLYTKVARK